MFSVLLLLTLFVPAALAAVSLPPLVKQPEPLPLKAKQARLNYLRREIKRLSIQVRRVSRSKRQPIVDKMNTYQNEIDDLLRVAPPPPIAPALGAAPAEEAPPPPSPPRIEALKKLRREVFMPRNPQLGISSGLIAGIPAARIDATFFEPYNISSSSGRLFAAYASGLDSENSMRKNLFVGFDGIYRLNQPYEPGWHYYVGGGANFTLLTTGRTLGSLGGDLFVGAEVGLWDGSLFLEAGLGLIRSGFGPRHSGASILLGFRG